MTTEAPAKKMRGPDHFGVTPPISIAEPTPRDLRASAVLADELEASSLSAQQHEVRQSVLLRIEAIVPRWVHAVALEHGLSAEQAAVAGGRLFALGSHALDVAMPGADIDLVAVVPYFVERRHFFEGGGLSGLLCSSIANLSGLHPVPDAFVPVLKFVVDGVPVDLLLARIKLSEIPPELRPDSEGLLKICSDEVDVHSLNGARVAAAILRLVPHPSHFRTTLRAVKLWALRHGLNCQAMGYPGGVAWAMLTARVCQMHPNAAPSTQRRPFAPASAPTT